MDAPNEPQGEDPFPEIMRGLADDRERRFVNGLLRGEPPEFAAKAAAYAGPFGVVRLLGRPRVQRALERLAPLLPDEALGARILRPVLMLRLVEATRGRQSLSALRDLLAIAPQAPQAQTAQDRWREAQERRARAQDQGAA